ncbi:MAG: ATP synthase subunit I [Rhodospirillaceae bacterium]|nr:ATP synthase subunit I [Rhodospirillaceae bacterium]
MNQNLLLFAPFLVAGLAVGIAFFAALEINARLYLTPTMHVRAVALHLARMAGAGAGFTAFAAYGGLALLAGLLGFLSARPIYVRWLRRTA